METISGELRFDYAVVNIQVDSKNKPFTDFQFFLICNDEEEAKKEI